MHGNDSTLFVCMLLGAIMLVIWLIFRKRPADVEMADEVEEAIRLLRTPRRGPGGIMVMFEVKMIEVPNAAPATALRIDPAPRRGRVA